MNRKCVSAGLSILVVLSAGCTEVLQALGQSRPKVKAVRPRITNLNFDGLDLAIDVDVSNPMPFAFPSPRLKYGLDLAGAEFLKTQEVAGAALPARGVGTISLPFSLNYSQLAQTYDRLKDAKEVDYTLHGGLLLSAMDQSFELPVSHSGTLPVLRPPTFSNVRVSDVSLRDATVTVEANIENPNAFDLGLAAVGYALQIGDMSVGNVVADTDRSIGPGESGSLKLTGKLSAADALLKLSRGGSLGVPALTPTGTIQTPFGPVDLQR